MFDKNLTDLVRGIRNNKDNEVRIPSSVPDIPFILFDCDVFVASIALN